MNTGYPIIAPILWMNILSVLSQSACANLEATSIINIQEQPLQLPVIAVSIDKPQQEFADGQLSKNSQVGILGTKDTLDIPFSVISYTEKYIADKNAKSVAQALESDASVRNIFSPNGLGEYFNIRGFYTQSHELAWNGLFGLVPHNRVPTEFLERVDVFRGSSALLNGMSLGGAVGGLINVVPKRAHDEAITRLTTSYTSDSNFAAHIDLGHRFGEDKKFGVRINALKSHGDTTLDEQTEDRRLASLAVDYRGEQLRIAFDAYNIKEKLYAGMPLMVSFAASTIAKAPDATINTMPDAYAVSQTTGLITHFEYDFLTNWMGYFTVGHKDQKSYGYMANNALGLNAQANGDYTAVSRQTVNQTEVDSFETGLRTTLQTGVIQHSVVLSANLIDQQQSAVAGNPVTWASNIYHPSPASNLGSLPTDIYTTSETTLSSIALADTLSWLGDSYQLVLGVRHQRVEANHSYDETALTPAIGVLIKPWDHRLSLYANYIQGLSQGASVSDSTAENYGEIFAPYKSQQYEIGAKWAFAQFSNTLSLYQMSKPSMIKNSRTNRYHADGEQRNRGVEWSVAGNILPDLRLLGGVAYIDAKYTKMAAATNEGHQAVGIPDWQANVGLECDIPQLQGFTLTANTIFTGHVYADEANSKQLSSWTRFDLGSRYHGELFDTNLMIRAGIDNVLNKQYWAGVWNGYASVGLPRTYKLSMQIDF